MAQSPDVTQLLVAWRDGSREALDTLMPVVMEELKRIARAYMAREANAETLQTTALVHEAYLRLIRIQPGNFEARAQFYALAAQIMRNILVDHARAQLAERKGGGARVVWLDPEFPIAANTHESLMGVHDALSSLEKLDARKGRVVELRLFGGLTNEEVASALGLSIRTVIREWEFAKAWLSRELNYRPGPE
ncbi:MAG: sigma-70 family RNA polymerase sigma factor [Bryobacteraceae bacterium]